MNKQLIILCFIWNVSFGQDTVRCISPVDITHTEWAAMPTADRVYYHSLMLQNERYNFYTNLRYWVERNGSKELRGKADMSERNFTSRLKNESFTAEQIKAMMKGFIKPYPPNMYGHDLSKEEEHELGKLQ